MGYKEVALCAGPFKKFWLLIAHPLPYLIGDKPFFIRGKFLVFLEPAGRHALGGGCFFLIQNMFSISQTNSSAKEKKETRDMRVGETFSEESIQKEWLEIQAAQRNPSHFKPLYDRYYEPIFR